MYKEMIENMREFKYELRMSIGFKQPKIDPWGYAMSAFFECAGHMYDRGLTIPSEWLYRPSPIAATDSDSEWHELFANSSDEMLAEIGDLLHRYTNFLRYKGVDY